VLAGCGSTGSLLDQGVSLGIGRKPHPVSSEEAIRDARASLAHWQKLLRQAAIRNPRRRFPSPPRARLLTRLDHAAARYDFHIEAVTLRRPDQLAPQILLESNHYLTLAHALPPILDRIDPPPRSNRRAYEGIYIEAVDQQQTPYVIVFDSLRGQIASGQWARSDALFPYDHG